VGPVCRRRRFGWHSRWYPVGLTDDSTGVVIGRYVSVAAVEPKSWAALCNGVGLPELLDREHVDEATATDQLARIFASAPAAEWVGRLGPSGTGIGAVNQGPEVVHDPHNLARGTTIRIGRVVVPANPIHLMRHDGSTVGTADREPPLAGADTDGALLKSDMTCRR